MSYKILHFRNADKIVREKKMAKEVKLLMEYLHDCLYGTVHKSELLRQALTEMNWRQNGDLNVLDGRKYFYKGYRNRIAIDGSFSSYEYIQDALLRLQIGFDKGKIDLGIVMLTSQRSDKSRLGTTEELIHQEIEMLHPTISLPVTIVLFDLGRPGEIYQDNAQNVQQEESDETVPDLKYSDLSEVYLHGNRANVKVPDGEPENDGEVSSDIDNSADNKGKGKKKRKSIARSGKPVVAVTFEQQAA